MIGMTRSLMTTWIDGSERSMVSASAPVPAVTTDSPLSDNRCCTRWRTQPTSSTTRIFIAASPLQSFVQSRRKALASKLKKLTSHVEENASQSLNIDGKRKRLFRMRRAYFRYIRDDRFLKRM